MEIQFLLCLMNIILGAQLVFFFFFRSSNITCVLITKKNLNSNLYFLISLKKKFEYIFKDVLIDVEVFEEKERLFKNFDVIIDDLLL